MSVDDSREMALFRSLATDAVSNVPWSALGDALQAAGLRLDDPRLAESVAALEDCDRRSGLDFPAFKRVVRPNIQLIASALQQRLVIPDFAEFRDDIDAIYARTQDHREGAVATYIPQLARVDPEQYGVALCTVDGQRHEIGDSDIAFCVQSCCKPFNYSIALEEHGEAKVHEHIGCEPSGHGFNELSLNKKGRPHNPLINSGAIMSCSLIKPDLSSADRFEHVIKTWTQLMGGQKPGFNNPTYLSERATADRNFAIGYFMREHGAFPEGTDLVETLEFYFQCCSLEATAEMLAIAAATLANAGVCPLTGVRVFNASTVQKCLSLMYSCGMYDFSGEWSFRIGLPAKSGVAGAIVTVIPNVMGLCTWSPRLDAQGNSARGIEFCRELIEVFNFHNYDNLVAGLHDKKDPRLAKSESAADVRHRLAWAASEGDLGSIRGLVARGVSLDVADHDGRTALHHAASGGHLAVLAYLVCQGVPLSPRDRWGGTPLDDARREQHEDAAAFLAAQGAIAGGN